MLLFVVKINATWAGCFKQSLQMTKGNAKYCDLVEVMLHGIWQIFKDGKCLCLLMCWLGITSFVCQASTVGFVRNGWLGLRLWLLTLFSRSSSPPLPFFFFPRVCFCFSSTAFRISLFVRTLSLNSWNRVYLPGA